jgi:hypothetical protein
MWRGRGRYAAPGYCGGFAAQNGSLAASSFETRLIRGFTEK